MTTFSIIYVLSFLFTIPLWCVAHNGLLGDVVCEKMLEEARAQGVEDQLLDKENNKTLVFMLGVFAVTPIVSTVLALLVIKGVLFKT